MRLGMTTAGYTECLDTTGLGLGHLEGLGAALEVVQSRLLRLLHGPGTIEVCPNGPQY